MESIDYEQFSATSDIANNPHAKNYKDGRQNRTVYILFGVLLLFLLILTIVTGVKCSCDEDWMFFQGSCYFLSMQKLNWQDAEQWCIQKGAHLIVLNNVEELDYISEHVRPKNYWIGLVQREADGEWSWVDGTDFNSTPHFWDEDQPDNWDVRQNGEDCGQLHAGHGHDLKLWNDADCTLIYMFICEGKPKKK